LENVLILRVHGQEDRARPRARSLDLAGCVDAVQERHAHVEHCRVRMELPGQTHRLPAVGGFAHHPKSFALQDRSQRLSEAEVVVGEENPDRHHISKGMATCTLVPRPGAEMIWKLPRTASSRSWMLTSPTPGAPRCARTVGASKPTPSSAIEQRIALGSRCSWILTRAASACRTAFVRASCTIRYSAVSTSCGMLPDVVTSISHRSSV